jgi:hypothetical protein
MNIRTVSVQFFFFDSGHIDLTLKDRKCGKILRARKKGSLSVVLSYFFIYHKMEAKKALVRGIRRKLAKHPYIVQLQAYIYIFFKYSLVARCHSFYLFLH